MEKQFRKKSAAKVAQKAAAHTSSGISLEDNRPSTIIQQKKNNTGLPDNLKSGIESLSGHSLDDVKVHYNSTKPAQLNAHAYAQGTNIHLASGQEKHLPHEAWHIVQQKQGRVRPTKTVNGAKINDNVGLEKEADVMGAKALQRKVKKTNLQSKVTVTNTNTLQRVAVIQMISGQWQKYLLTLADYSEDAARNWEDRLEQAEKAGVAPPRQTEHASGSGAGDRGNKAQQMTKELDAWWNENKAKITSSGSKDEEEEKSSKKDMSKRHTKEEEEDFAKRKQSDKHKRKQERMEAYKSSQQEEEALHSQTEEPQSRHSQYLIQKGREKGQYPPKLNRFEKAEFDKL